MSVQASSPSLTPLKLSFGALAPGISGRANGVLQWKISVTMQFAAGNAYAYGGHVLDPRIRDDVDPDREYVLECEEDF
ncbi:hypothetical protein Hypma_000027 [Hypsizygus marmoreus]|uniref:Uncharacterized protein n=1 Tax=Hypsizygus marmoreus TaxID=39966 RepID=A0A369KBY2_HYPMA|nr:hypothetical protein Hypma_000027 [Hypsizygus marmoreus]